jgi:predicted ribosome quality control (RQC) complex YloA/Tae2 family protein
VSHAGESDVMEEIAKLKRRIEEQDQIIEGFRNQDEVCGLIKIAMLILFLYIHINK